MVDYFMTTPFSRRMDPEDKKFQRCVNNPTWWQHRREIMEKYFLPCVDNQTFQDFHKIATFEPVSEPTEEKDKTRELLQDWGWQTVTLDEYPTHWPTPWEQMRETGNDDWIVIYEADSDDILSPVVMEIIADQDSEEYACYIFREGYAYGLQDKKMGIYQHISSQFYAKCFPREVLDDVDDYVEYSNEARFNGGHPDLRRGPNPVYLPDGNFIHCQHGHQDSSGWDDKHTVKHITEWIENDQRKKEILETFNVPALMEGF